MRQKFDIHPDKIVREFASHPFNRIGMPRCQHIRFHQRHREAVIPPRDVMAAFLEEAAILTQLGVTVKALADIEEALFTDNPRKAARDSDRYLEWHEEFTERRDHLARRAQNFEVVPRRLVVSGIQRFLSRGIIYSPFESDLEQSTPVVPEAA